MSISYVSSGAAVYTTANPAPLSPAHAVDDLLILTIGTKPDTTPATTPAGWTLLGAVSGGTGTTGIDTGPMRVGIFYRVASSTGTADDPGAITITGNNVSAAQIHAFRKTNALAAWELAGTGAADTTTGTPFSAVMPLNPGLTVGDMLMGIGVIPTDVTTPAQFTAETVAATGMTTVTLTEIVEWDTATGQDMGGWIGYGPVVTGTATAAPTVSATAAGTTTNVAGPIYLVRMREITPVSKTASDSGTFSATEGTPTVTPIMRPNLKTRVTSVTGRSTATTVSLNIDTQPGDLLVVKTGTESGSLPINTVSGGGLVWTRRTPQITNSNNCDASVWTAIADSTTTIGITATTIANVGNMSINKYILAEAWGNAKIDTSPVTFSSTSAGGAPNLTVNTTGTGSIISWQNADWSAVDPTNHVWRDSPTEEDVIGNPGLDFIVYLVYQVAQNPGAQTVGMTFPTGQTPTLAGIEIQYNSPVTDTPVSASDSGTLSATETSNVVVALSSSDSGVLSGVESTTILSSLNRTDTGTISATESTQSSIAVATSDTGNITATEASSAIVFLSLSSSDSGTISATESTTSLSTIVRGDSGTLSAVDQSASFLSSASSDSGTLSAIDASQSSLQVNSGDSGTLSAIDSSSIFESAVKNGNDIGVISATEASSVFVTVSASDSGTISASDTSAAFKTITASDSGVISATEGAVVFNDRLTTDAGVFIATETSSVEIFGTVVKTSSDSGILSALESTSTAVSLEASDASDLTAVESTDIFSTLSSDDSGDITAVEDATALVTMESTDGGVLSAIEATSNQIFQGFIVDVWDGTKFVSAALVVWNGTDFVDPIVQRWDGDSWV